MRIIHIAIRKKLTFEEYRAKYYGETIEKARQNLPDQEKVLE